MGTWVCAGAAASSGKRDVGVGVAVGVAVGVWLGVLVGVAVGVAGSVGTTTEIVASSTVLSGTSGPGEPPITYILPFRPAAAPARHRAVGALVLAAQVSEAGSYSSTAV